MRSVIALLLITGGLSACDRQSPPREQANAGSAVTSGEVTSGEVKGGGGKQDAFKFTIDRSKAGTPAPDLPFQTPEGGKTTLKAFASKPLLVNLWATWCTPCVAEMPTLDALAGDYAKQGLQVLTISQDSQGKAQVDPFFAKRRFVHLKPWLDPENQLGFHYATGLLPTSILYDAQGREVARVIGAMDWKSKDAAKLIEDTLKAS